MGRAGWSRRYVTGFAAAHSQWGFDKLNRHRELCPFTSLTHFKQEFLGARLPPRLYKE